MIPKEWSITINIFSKMNNGVPMKTSTMQQGYRANPLQTRISSNHFSDLPFHYFNYKELRR